VKQLPRSFHFPFIDSRKEEIRNKTHPKIKTERQSTVVIMIRSPSSNSRASNNRTIVSRSFPLPSLINVRSFPVINPKRGDTKGLAKPDNKDLAVDKSNNRPNSEGVSNIDDTPFCHPSHVPTPTTLEGLIPHDVHEVLFDTLPATFEKIFSFHSWLNGPVSLDGDFWAESALAPRRRRLGGNHHETATALQQLLDNDEESSFTALQRQWQVENAFNLHQAISSRRLLDKDYNMMMTSAKQLWQCCSE
jgi:hypothetical protein